MSRINKEAKKRLNEIENMIQPGQEVYVWHLRGEYYVNDDGEKLTEDELPQGENVINIIIECV